MTEKEKLPQVGLREKTAALDLRTGRVSVVPPSVATLMLTCLVNAGHLSEAEALLDDPRLANGGMGPRYELALAYAEEGRLDAALRQFDVLLKRQPNEPQVRQAAVNVLRAQAGRAVANQDWDSAAKALRTALGLAPGDGALQSCLDAVGEAIPTMHLARGEREKAAAAWEEAQKAKPTDYRVAHELAILYHRWAIDSEQAGDISAADRLWRHAMANWVLVAHADEYWLTWKAARESVYGTSINADDLEKLRRTTLRERLEQIHRDFEAAYTEVGDSRSAARHREYRTLFKLEARSALALKEGLEALRKARKPADCQVCAGPLMLGHLDMMGKATAVAAAVKQLRNVASSAANLGIYLSPLGRLQLLIEDHQADQALGELRNILEADPRNVDARQLIVQAYQEAGKACVGNEPVTALETWAEGLTYEPGNRELKGLIVETCTQQAGRMSRAGDLDGAVELLKHGLGYVPDNKDLRTSLARACRERGVRRANSRQWAAAVEDLRVAVQYEPQSNQYGEDLATCCSSRAVELANEATDLAKYGQRTGAERRFTEAIGLCEEGLRAAPHHAACTQNLEAIRMARTLLNLRRY